MAISKHEITVMSISVLFGIAAYSGVDIHLASLPFIAEYMHASKIQVQQSVPIYILGMALSLFFYGPLSDRIGRRPVMIFSLIFASLFCFIGAVTTHIGTFLLTRFLQGLGTGACIGMGRAIAVDVIQGDRMAVLGSYFSMATTMSPLLAPALGGYVQHYLGWQMNFVFYGVFLLLVLAITVFFMPETNQLKNRQAIHFPIMMKTYGSLIRHRLFLSCLLISGFVIGSGTVYNTVSSYIFQKQYHLSPIVFGWVTAITAVGSIIAKIFGPMSIRRITGFRTMNIGIWMLVLSGVLILLFLLGGVATVSLIVIAVMVRAGSQSIVMPNITSLALSSFHDRRGAAAALYSASQLLIAFVVASVVGGSAYEGVTLLGVAFLGLGILSLLLYRLMLMPANPQ